MSELNINQKINIRGLVEEFPKIGKKEFLERFRKLKIGDTGYFVSAVNVSAQLKGGHSVLLMISYPYYGIFPHYGVGKGISKEDNNVRRLVGSGRKAKPWMKGISHIGYRLGEVYTEIVGKDISEKVLESIERKAGGKPIILFKKGY